MKRQFFLWFWLILGAVSMAWAGTSYKENIFAKDKGFFTCSGGTSSPLFKQDCRQLTLDRVSFGGDIVYEGWCLDSNGTRYVLSCLTFTFEPDKVTSEAKQNFFDK